jgi:dTDP-4-dehydrorhamnose 3,5-epimerase
VVAVNIEGVEIVDLQVHEDPRGTFVEFFRQSWIPSEHPALQVNVSRSRAGVLRAMHLHRRQWDYWFVLSGEAFVALADLRDGSPTDRSVVTMRLSGEGPRGLFIPPGVAHGFFAETDLVLGYVVDRYFDGSDELAVAWDDPDLAIEWPTRQPVLSERDRANPSLREARRDPPRYEAPLG